MPSPNETPDRYAKVSPMNASYLRRRKIHYRSGSAQHPDEHTQEDETGPWVHVNWGSQNIVLPLLAYIWDIFGYASRHFLKPIFGIALGFGIIIFMFNLGSSIIYSKFSAALAPLCLIPGSSYIIPACAVPDSDPLANFEDLITVQTHFEEILDSQKDTATLPATLKDSEIAIRDLRILVGASRLPSRQQLNLEFDTFVATAKEAATDLSRYNSRIGSAMDRVIATNTWTMNVLRGIEETESNTGSLSRIFTSLTSSFLSAPPTLQQRIFDQYILHVSKNKEEIEALISTAQALLQVLTNLDERLDTIHTITTSDDSTLTRSQDELLSSLWTKLGGNSASVKSNNRHLNLLRNISQYRRKALKHVSETLLKLQEIQAELENLRDGVAAPEVLGWRGGVGIEYYVEVVERGVERLRIARGESRRVEGEALQGRLGRGSEGVREVEGGPAVVTAKVRGS